MPSPSLDQAVIPEVEKKIGHYLKLLDQWNRVYNLTTVPAPERYQRHILDSLSILPKLAGNNILDIGTGAGLPGIPLALACPQRHFVLLDKSAKKCRFLKQVVIELQLSHVNVVQSRVEEYHPDSLFDTVVSRAFAHLAEFVQAAWPLCQPEGYMLAMKGSAIEREIGDDLPPSVRVVETQTLEVPGAKSPPCVVVLRREDQVPGHAV